VLRTRWLVAHQRLSPSGINPGSLHATGVARYHTHMYTQCPDCLTVFELDMASLTSAHGRVCCGYCSAEFDTLQNLSSNPPNPDSTQLPQHPGQASLPRLLESIWQPPLQSDPDTSSTETTDSEQPAPQPEATASLLLAEPETSEQFASVPDPAGSEPPAAVVGASADMESPPPAITNPPDFVRAPRHNGLWWLGGLLLTVSLVGQIAYTERAMLIRNKLSRNWVERVYQIIGKPLPLVSDPAMLQLLDRDIRPHPSVAGALLISANLRNQAPFSQPYPVVEVILSNLKGQRIAMRRFRPQAYVSNRTQRRLGLPAGATAAISFEVVDPGQKAVAFEIHLQ